MLADFQQALADLTASPALCYRVRSHPLALYEKYALTEREWKRLVGMVQHRGMQCACIVYRANRLAPLTLNLPLTCKALGEELRSVVSEFWGSFSEAHVHFFVESDRFCRFLKAKLEEGRIFPAEVGPALRVESVVIRAALEESYTER